VHSEQPKPTNFWLSIQTSRGGIAALEALAAVCGMVQNVVRLLAYAFKTMIPEYDILRAKLNIER
jgi:hypothetical protein